MPKFDIWLDDKKVIAVKHGEELSNKPRFSFFKTVTSSTKALAKKNIVDAINSGAILKEKKVKRISSSKYDFSAPKKEKKEEIAIPYPESEKKAIYCDFNGVLDDRNKTSNSSEISFQLPELACENKVYMLAKLAVKHNAYLVFTSLHRNYGGSLYVIIFRTLRNSENKEHQEFLEENSSTLKKLCRVSSTDDLGKRTDEILIHVISHKYSHFVVFEDDHFIQDILNPIMTDYHYGLTQQHIDDADKILSEPFKFQM